MVEINPQFRELVVSDLNRMAEPLDLGPAEPGEDHLIATAVFSGMDIGIKTRTLDIVQRKDSMLHIILRNAIFSGSPGSQSNRTVSYIMDHLFFPPDEDEEKTKRDQIELCGIMLDLYRLGQANEDQLLALCALASNGSLLATRTVLDPDDGEIYVDAHIPCDFVDLPEKFEETIRTVLSHAALLQRLEQLVRGPLSHQQAPSPRMLSLLSRQMEALKKDQAAVEEEKYTEEKAITI